jgi:copper chaperone
MQTTLTISGMTCDHCVAAVNKALHQVPGVERTEVSLDPQQAVVTGNTDPRALIAAIEDEGYEASVQ